MITPFESGEMRDPTARSSRVNEIEAVRISLAGPDDIRSWSSGEVTQAGTFDAADGSVVEGGLFCENIFGPLQDWRCQCGKLFGEEQKNRYCDVCDHFPSYQPQSQTRMGHIELACPVVHPWFCAANASPLSLLLDIDNETLRKLVQYDAHLVTDVGQTSLKYHEILTDQTALQAQEDFGYGQPRTLTGAEAVRRLVDALDLDELAKELRQQLLNTDSRHERAGLQKRLSLVESLRDSGNNPSWMLLDVLPVVPPVVRPARHGVKGITAHGLNALYGHIMRCNFQLGKAEELEAPERIVIDCKKRLQQAVDELFDEIWPASAYDRPDTSQASLKQQLVRDIRTSFPLGKSVDFSAWSVVVPNSQLRLDQCGLPKRIALTLYEPLIVRYLLDHRHAGTLHLARVFVSRKADVVWEALESVMCEHWVLLSRPPILRRQRIQAFQPRLVEGNAIHIHPLLGQQFGVEFGGEQLKVFLPLSIEAQTEAKRLLSSANNLFDTQAGQLAIVPEKDVVLGCHYLTVAKTGCRGEGMIFSSPEEAVSAWQHDRVDLHAVASVRLKPGQSSSSHFSWVRSESEPDRQRIVETTIGRVLFNEVLPAELDFYDVELDTSLLSAVIEDCFRKVGRERTMEVLEAITRLAHQHLSSSGLSLGIQDLLVPWSKAKHIEQAEKVIIRVKKSLDRGFCTRDESYNQQLDAWVNARERITSDLMSDLNSVRNLLSLMAETKTFADINGLSKLCGMFGLMTDQHRRIRPIKANFREGLQVTDYWNHLLGTRQSLLTVREQQLNRDYGGRLSRLLQDIVITMEDCGTQQSVAIGPIHRTMNSNATGWFAALKPILDQFAAQNRVLQSLSHQAKGRVASETIVSPITDKTVVAANQLITHEIATELERMGLNCLQVRSPMTCKAPTGICQRCYGMDHSTQDLVEVGTAIGIHAVFAITDALERVGKVLLRIFEMGSGARIPMDYETFLEKRSSIQHRAVAGEEVEIRAEKNGIVNFENVELVGDTVLNEKGALQVLDAQGRIMEAFPLPRGTTLSVKQGEAVQCHQVLANVEAYVDKLFALQYGIATLHFDGDDDAEISRHDHIVIHQDDLPRHPRIVISDESGAVLEVHYLGAGFRVSNSLISSFVPARVSPGSVLAESELRNLNSIGISLLSPFERRRILVGLLEARGTINRMTLAPVDAKVINVERQMNGSHQILLSTAVGNVLKERVRMNPRVRPGDVVRAGDPLTDGTPSLFDVLAIRGLSYTMSFLRREFKKMFLHDRIDLADQHIELVISRLLSRAKITDAGDSNLSIGTVVERSTLRSVNHELSHQRRVANCGDSSLQVGELVSATEFEQASEQIRKIGGRPPESTPAQAAVGKVMLQGMTKSGIARCGFLTEARFQDLRSVLTNAALAGQSDELRSLNSNVMLGRLIPVGTGHRTLLDGQVQIRPLPSPQEQTFPLPLEDFPTIPEP